MNRQAEVKEFLPLSPAALHNLLALAGEDLLSAQGRRVLAAEVARLETVVRDAKGYLLGAKPRRA